MATIRCDACSIAGARVRAVKGRYELFFCQHHGFQYMKAMQEQGWTMLVKKKKGAQ